MSLFKKNPLLKLGLLALVVVGLPAAVFLSQKQVENRSRASRTVILSYTPSSTSSSPISVQPGNSVSLDLMLNPGASAVSFLKTELNYDATKFQVANGGFAVNQQAFPEIVQAPTYTTGKVSFSISVGVDGTKAIQSPTKVGTLTLTALPSSAISPPSQITFDPNTLALSIGSGSTYNENVVASTSPAYIRVGNAPSISPTGLPACANNPSETMLVMDKSGSMSTATGPSRLAQAKAAAKSFVDIIAQDTQNTIGLVSYDYTATADSPLTTNYASVKTKIDALDAIGSTCTECGILKANQQIAQSSSSKKKVVILLTDGIANFVEGNANQVAPALAEQRAIAAATAGHAAKGTVFYTIGLGNEINAAFLQQIATSTGGQYFASPTGDQLNAIYSQISQLSGRGSITGAVFNDANNNAVFDPTEAKLSGWTLHLRAGQSNAVQQITSDANGFNITGLCNGSYTLSEVIQSGWRQTLPTNPNTYTINITNGNAVTGKNFGNKQGNTCADGIDNNHNNFIDIQDPICHTDGNRNNPNSYDPNLPERNGNTCADGIDNNNNNLIDGLDPICHTDGNPNNPNSYDPDRPEQGNTCADGIDNNHNNFIDIQDPICHTDGNRNNPNSYDPNLPERNGNTCADGIDNNNNNLIDGLDPICHTGGNLNNPYNPDLPETNVTTGTRLSLTLLLHGIGSAGDNATSLNTLSTKNPLHPTRNAEVFIYDIDNKLVSTTSGTVNYASASGDFRGTVVTKTTLAAGNYNIRVRSDQHLIRLIPGIQAIVNTGTNQLRPTALVAGDVNDDNKLNILDYNLLIGCSTTVPDPLCTGVLKIQTDLDDNGVIDIKDYNLFLRELSTQLGE